MKFLPRWAAALLLISLAMAMSSTLYGKEEVIGKELSPVNKKLLVVRVNKDYPPYEMTFEGKLTGLHIELVNAVADRLNITIEYQSYPWKRAVVLVKEGQADAITYFGKNPEREKYAYFFEGNKISNANNYFLILNSRKDEINFVGDFSSVRNYVIGVSAGYRYGLPFDEIDYLKKQELTESSDKKLIDMLLHERVDIVVSSYNALKQVYGGSDTFTKIYVIPTPITEISNYIAFSKKRVIREMAFKFSQEMGRFKQTNEFEELLRKYDIKNF